MKYDLGYEIGRNTKANVNVQNRETYPNADHLRVKINFNV